MLLAGSIGRAIDVMQADCGKVLGIGQAQLSKYEKGQNTPTLDLLLKLRSYSGRRIDWIVTGEEVGRREYRPTLLRRRSASLTGWRRIPIPWTVSPVPLFGLAPSVVQGSAAEHAPCRPSRRSAYPRPQHGVLHRRTSRQSSSDPGAPSCGVSGAGRVPHLAGFVRCVGDDNSDCYWSPLAET